MAKRRTTGSKRANSGIRLDRDLILRAALEVVAEHGHGAVTMRKVGAALGADPTAIYRHFHSKDELVSALADRLFGELLLEEIAGPWRERLKHTLAGVHAIYRGHPAFVEVLANLPEQTESLQQINERTLRCLVEAGLPADEIGFVQQLLTAHVIGTGVLDAAWDEPDALAVRAAARRACSALPPDEFPFTIALSSQLFPPADPAFDYAIDLILDAIEQRCPATATAGTAAHEGATPMKSHSCNGDSSSSASSIDSEIGYRADG